MRTFDMHCHVDLMPSMTDFANDALKASICLLAVTTTPKAYEKEITVLRPFPNVRVALGLHPQLIGERYSEIMIVEKYLEDAHYIGEIGLDFNKQFYHSKDKQLVAFERIIKRCGELGGKVLSIHSVHADKLTLDVIEKYAAHKQNTIILHWFSGTQKQLQRAVQLGCYFSINSAMTKSDNGRRIIQGMPADRMLLESDAPFIGQNNAQQLLADLELTAQWLSSNIDVNINNTIVDKSTTIFNR